MSYIKLKKSSKPFEMIDRNTIQTISNPDALAIWVYLQSKPDDWIVRNSEIKKHFGIGESRRTKAFKVLKELGLYEVVRVKDNNGKFVANYLKINDAVTTKNRTYGNPCIRESVHTETGGYITKEENTTKEESITKEKNITTKAIVQEIYNEYPKKVGRASAIKSIEKAIKKIDPQELLMIVREYAQAISWKDKQYIPNPSTWFNQERWTDDRNDWKDPRLKQRMNGFGVNGIGISNHDNYDSSLQSKDLFQRDLF